MGAADLGCVDSLQPQRSPVSPLTSVKGGLTERILPSQMIPICHVVGQYEERGVIDLAEQNVIGRRT